MRMKDKIALVLGAAGRENLGQVIARRFAESVHALLYNHAGYIATQAAGAPSTPVR